MRTRDIIQLVNNLKTIFKTNDPEQIINNLDYIRYGETSINPNVFKAQAINYNNWITILINKNYTNMSRKFLLAHELGHAVLHKQFISYMGKADITKESLDREFEANLFAVALLINENDLCVNFENLTHSDVSAIMEANIKLKECC